jgi:hypothetical protein
MVPFVVVFVESADAGLKAGAARISIVPPFPTLMGGFAARTKDFTGVHDEVYARALALDNGTTAAVIIGSDLRSVDDDLTRQVRELILKAAGIPATNILICSTHNHSGPSYHQKTEIGQDDVEPSLKRFLIKQFADVGIEAIKAMEPAKAGFGAGSLTGLTRNRQQKNDLIDPQVGVFRVEALQGRKTIATLMNFTGHPVAISSDNLLLSGEYPGVACRSIEQLLGGIAIFTQGACGDITINRNGDPFLEIERIGRTVTGEVIKTSGMIELSDEMPIVALSKTVSLPARQLQSVEGAKKELEAEKAALAAARTNLASTAAIALLEDKHRVASMAVVMAEAIAKDPSRWEKTRNGEVQVLELGNVIFGSIPGEIFVEYALELRSRVKQDAGKSFCLVGYANGYLGYIVTPRAAQTGGYEASVARLDVSSGRMMTEAVMELVHQIGRN